jgi:hypothetical protein
MSDQDHHGPTMDGLKVHATTTTLHDDTGCLESKDSEADTYHFSCMKYLICNASLLTEENHHFGAK